MINFPPLPSDEDCRKIAERNAGLITPITICECGIIIYHHRLGCSCGKWTGDGVEWAFEHGGKVIRPDIDFCLIDHGDKQVQIKKTDMARMGEVKPIKRTHILLLRNGASPPRFALYSDGNYSIQGQFGLTKAEDGDLWLDISDLVKV